MKAIILFAISFSCVCLGDNTNKTVKADPGNSTNKTSKVEQEKKIEHKADKIIKKTHDKGSAEPWKTEKEYPLMFSNNKKAKKVK
jgi:hypothetical protein